MNAEKHTVTLPIADYNSLLEGSIPLDLRAVKMAQRVVLEIAKAIEENQDKFRPMRPADIAELIRNAAKNTEQLKELCHD